MLLEAVRRTIRRHDLAARDTRVVIALSGGGDSVALAHVLRELDGSGELSVAGIAHFNHQLRDAADRDEAFCQALAAEHGWPFLAGREDVRARAAGEHRSIEDAARTARHEFFARARAHFSADVVAVGHTRDDQAETFLLRLLRGAGPRGLSAMHPRSGDVIRPLLDCRRAELRAWLETLGLAYLNDETNADVAIPRNRVRAELLPLLEARFNPSIVDALASQAELARDDWNWMLDEVRSKKLEARSTAELLAAPRALRRLALWRAMTEAAGGRTVSLAHVEAVLELLESPSLGGSIDAPGHVVERVGDRVVLRSGRSDGAHPEPDPFRYPLSIPGEVTLPEHGLVVSAHRAGVPGAQALGVVGAMPRNRATAVIAADGWAAPLAVRNRRPGDRFRPFGLNGQKKLQDFLVDRKVARADRDRVPLVVDENDRILWVAGHEIDEAFRVTEASRAVIILTLRQV
jgi:tRNA(Ile)-lysidine synthase